MKQYKKHLAFVIFAFASIFFLVINPVWASPAPNENGATSVNIDVNNNIGAVVDGENLNVIGIGAVVSLAIGDSNTAIATGVQINGVSQETTENNQLGVGSVAIGGGNNATGAWTQAIGHGNTSLGAGATAGTLANPVIGGTALGAYSEAKHDLSVALGAGSVTDRPNSVSVGDAEHNYQRQITNLAPGILDTDAVNMSQLRNVDGKVNRVGAMAFALSALAPLPYDPKDPTQYSAGIGTYNGSGAVALGVYHYTRPTVMYNAAVAMSDDGWERSARVGVTWRTGGAKPKVLTPATVKSKAIEEGSILDRVNKLLAGTN